MTDKFDIRSTKKSFLLSREETEEEREEKDRGGQPGRGGNVMQLHSERGALSYVDSRTLLPASRCRFRAAATGPDPKRRRNRDDGQNISSAGAHRAAVGIGVDFFPSSMRGPTVVELLITRPTIRPPCLKQ